ncbi:MAG: Ig-like domain-containing protein, partial [Chloroflexota bacterium]
MGGLSQSFKTQFKRIGPPGLALLLVAGLVSGAAAQQTGPFVTVTGLDGQTFPTVTTYIAVTGPDGRPVTGLTAADFSLREDNSEVSTKTVAVTETTSLPNLRLILALDLSVPAETLAQVKQAATALIDTMKDGDRIALVAFHDQVQVVQILTNNKTELQQSIAGLKAQGNYTALNKAAQEAVNLAGETPSGRQAVIILTDKGDNTAGRAATGFVQQAQTKKLPLYVLGIGSNIRQDTLAGLAGPTGGQAFTLAEVGQIEPTLLNLTRLLRQGYQVTFQSGLPADGTEHDLILTVYTPAGSGQAGGRFVAVPGEVNVNLLNLAEGQTVGGPVELAIEAQAPGPITRVDYLLDGRALKRLTEPPYRTIWDSATIAPGPHVLTAVVVDSAGNQGQAEVRLIIAPPLVVAVSTTQTKVGLGEEVAVQTRIEALAEIIEVEFLLDGQVLGRSITQPYSFAFDSSQYQAGVHTITVRVEDRLGRRQEDSTRVTFLPPPPPPPNPLALVALAAVVILTLLGLLLILALFRAIVAGQKRGCQKSYQLALANEGNIPSSYQLWADQPAGELKFQFKLNGAPLLTRYAAQPPATLPNSATSLPAAEVGPAVQSPRAETGPAAQPQPVGAQQVAERAMGGGSLLVNILDTAGMLLPGSWGHALRHRAGQMRLAQWQASQVTY